MKKYKFQATLQAGIGGGAGVIFPYDVEREFGTRGQVRVKATFDGVPYTGSLVKCGPAAHMIGVLKAIREQIGKGAGQAIEVVLWKDDEPRVVDVPAEFAALLKKEGLQAAFDKLSFTHRKEYCRWIAEAKREETRKGRLTKAIALLRSGVKTPD
jgi:hypothetical protein